LMKRAVMYQIKGMSLRLKFSLILLLLLFASVFMPDGLFQPQGAAAAVAALNNWPATPQVLLNGVPAQTTVASASGTVTFSAGTNRAMLVVVACDYSAAPTGQKLSVTYGGKSVSQIAANISQGATIWLGYLDEADLAAAGSGQTLLVKNNKATNLTAMYASAAVFSGVDQTASPISGYSTQATASGTSMTPAAFNVTAQAANAGLSQVVANWNTTTATLTAPSGYTASPATYAGANFRMGFYTKSITATGTEAPAPAVSVASAGAMVGFGLVPAGLKYTVSTCSDCHYYYPADAPTTRGTPTGQFRGSHNKHAGSADGQYGYECTRCHYNAAGLNHSTGFKNISGSSVPRNTYGGTTNIAITNSPSFNTCSRATCHSTGRSNPQYTTTPTWGSTNTSCLICHAGRSATNPYPPANSTLGFKLSTTHSQHLKYPAANVNCNMCHGKTATNSFTLKVYSSAMYHANGTADVLFTDIAYGSYTAYKTATKKCSNVACHGGTTRSGWSNQGAVNSNHTCTHCHGTATGVPISNTNRNFYAPGYNGGTSTDGNTASSDIRVGAHFAHLTSVYMKKIKCNECHTVPSNPFDGTHMTGPRYSSQSLAFGQASTARILIGVASGSTPAQLAVFTGYTNGTAAKAATCSSVYCHGNRMKNNITSGTARKPSWNQDLTATPATATSCGRCHGFPPTDGALHTAGDTVCSSCHSHVSTGTNPTTFVNKALHINGQVESSGGTCLGCHGSVKGIRAQIVGAAALGNAGDDFMRPSRHVKGSGTSTAIVKNLDCVICHAEGDTSSTEASPVRHATLHGDGTVNLRDVDAPASNWAWPGIRGGGATITSTDRDNMDTFCMRCHDSDTSSATASRGGAYGIAVNSTNTALLTTGPTARRTTPFNTLDGGSALDVRGQFNYQNLAGSAWASHHNLNQFTKRYTASYATTYSTRGGWTGTSKDGVAMGWATGLHCSDCHLNEANAHGSRNTPRMLQTSAGTDATYSYIGLSANNLVCYRCHLNTVYADDATDTTKSRMVHQTYDTKPWNAGYSADARGVATCLNCHNGGTNGAIGGIHGNNRNITPGGGSATKTYRFLYGSEHGIYNGSDALWANTTQPTCYTNQASWGGSCSSHENSSTTGRIAAPTYSRPLQ
jgi:predicted CxxxxCH...CXXCH cytochrome family protein